jgi:hypothetical protein
MMMAATHNHEGAEVAEKEKGNGMGTKVVELGFTTRDLAPLKNAKDPSTLSHSNPTTAPPPTTPQL